MVSGLSLHACEDATEAPRVTLPVVVDAPVNEQITTNTCYDVVLSQAQVVVRDVVFTVAGEVHAVSMFDRVITLLHSQAYAHPGHFQGGEVTGELRGRFVLDWMATAPIELGSASLIVGTYNAANFTFDRADTSHGLSETDPLIGHTARLVGTATRDGKAVNFTLIIDSPDGRELIGAPFDATITANSTGRLKLRFALYDALENDTLFDDIDFLALDSDGDGDVTIAPDDAAVEDAYNTLRRTFQTHDHFAIQHEE